MRRLVNEDETALCWRTLDSRPSRLNFEQQVRLFLARNSSPGHMVGLPTCCSPAMRKYSGVRSTLKPLYFPSRSLGLDHGFLQAAENRLEDFSIQVAN
jgi:hypothetical protein